MPLHTVTKVGKTKNGRDTVYFDNHHAVTDAFMVGNTCNVPPLNATIDADYACKNYQGKDFWWLNAFKVVTAQSTPRWTRSASQTEVIPDPPGSRALSEPELRFISNCVGSALAAGTLKEPAMIGLWAREAYKAIQPDSLNELEPF